MLNPNYRHILYILNEPNGESRIFQHFAKCRTGDFAALSHANEVFRFMKHRERPMREGDEVIITNDVNTFPLRMQRGAEGWATSIDGHY